MAPWLECAERNQRTPSGKGTAMEDFETEGEKLWRITPIVCRTAGVPRCCHSATSERASEARADVVGRRLQRRVRRRGGPCDPEIMDVCP
jgi:hypothetical protein